MQECNLSTRCPPAIQVQKSNQQKLWVDGFTLSTICNKLYEQQQVFGRLLLGFASQATSSALHFIGGRMRLC